MVLKWFHIRSPNDDTKHHRELLEHPIVSFTQPLQLVFRRGIQLRFPPAGSWNRVLLGKTGCIPESANCKDLNSAGVQC